MVSSIYSFRYCQLTQRCCIQVLVSPHVAQPWKIPAALYVPLHCSETRSQKGRPWRFYAGATPMSDSRCPRWNSNGTGWSGLHSLLVRFDTLLPKREEFPSLPQGERVVITGVFEQFMEHLVILLDRRKVEGHP